MHFTLIHQTTLVLVHKFDWVFNGDDVVVPFGVDLIQHGRQGGGFARTGGSGHQNQAARLVAQLGNDLRQVQLLE